MFKILKALQYEWRLWFWYQVPQLVDQVPGNRKNPGRLVPLCHLVEELDDVREVHVAVEDDVSVAFDETEGDEKIELVRGDFLWGPYCLPDTVDIVIAELPLEVQQEPAVAEVEVGEVAVLLDFVIESPVKDLHERAHVGEVLVHLVPCGEVPGLTGLNPDV